MVENKPEKKIIRYKWWEIWADDQSQEISSKPISFVHCMHAFLGRMLNELNSSFFFSWFAKKIQNKKNDDNYSCSLSSNYNIQPAKLVFDQ